VFLKYLKDFTLYSAQSPTHTRKCIPLGDLHSVILCTEWLFQPPFQFPIRRCYKGNY
jgi:hypothetical protein